MTKQPRLAATLNALDTQVFEQSPFALCVCSSPSGEIIRFNELAVRLWGRIPEPGERLTGAWRTRFPDGRVMTSDQSAMNAVIKGAGAIHAGYSIIERPDGSLVWVSAHVSPLQDEDGHLVGAVSAFDDVTEPAASDPEAGYPALLTGHDQLQKLEMHLHRVVESALIGVWDYDLVTRRAVRSRTHDQIYGYARPLPEWTIDTFLDHIAPEDRDTIRARFEECVSRGAGEFDCRITRADGAPAWIWSRGHVVRDLQGTPVRLVGIVIDVSARHRAEHWRAGEGRRKDVFVATLAHELRQPLSAMLAAIEVLRLGTTKTGADRAIEVMRRQIGQMNRLIDDVVNATRWARGKVTLVLTRLDLRDVLNESAADVAGALADHGHELIAAAEPSPLWVNGDRQRLYQVFSNLLRNAVKFTPPGGRICLSATRTASTVEVRVRDTGCGLDPQSLVRIFDLFTQISSSESTGLGIGLSVVREIAMLHGGTIEARSEGIGKGSEFLLTLPLATDTNT
jgi:PAS domain S-box-containing protein